MLIAIGILIIQGALEQLMYHPIDEGSSSMMNVKDVDVVAVAVAVVEVDSVDVVAGELAQTPVEN